MSGVFDAYARYYDLLYRDKDYAAEAQYVAAAILKKNPTAKTVLDLGCGTGAHAEHLSRLGFTVRGVDRSSEMIEAARARKAAVPREVGERLSFATGDALSLSDGSRYDAVVSLFHVMNYHATNADLSAAFDVAARHLNPGGVFAFDFWYGPAVLTEQPAVRVKRLQDDAVSITRIAEPTLDAAASIVDVAFTVFVQERDSRRTTILTETHRMRYLFLSEIHWLGDPLFEGVVASAWLRNEPLRATDWSGFVQMTRRRAPG
jgi:SAM-dependent methyltransferase